MWRLEALCLSASISASTISLTRSLKQDARLPSQNLFCLGCVAKKQIDFCGSEVTRIDLDVLLPVEIEVSESFIEEFADGVRFTCGDDEIVGLVMLQHHPHGFHVVACIAPVPLRIEIPEE